MSDDNQLTKVEQFALAAMQAILSNPSSWSMSHDAIAEDAVNYASAMIRAIRKYNGL